MDPDVTWKELRRALAEGDLEEARERAGALLAWLDSGGFPPRDEECSSEDEERLRFAVETTCRAVLGGQTVGRVNHERF